MINGDWRMQNAGSWLLNSHEIFLKGKFVKLGSFLLVAARLAYSRDSSWSISKVPILFANLTHLTCIRMASE
jgi:hypothetical protein